MFLLYLYKKNCMKKQENKNEVMEMWSDEHFTYEFEKNKNWEVKKITWKPLFKKETGNKYIDNIQFTVIAEAENVQWIHYILK